MSLLKERIYQKYRLSPEALLGKGMEAEVYAYGPDTVLKLYDGTAELADLTRLKCLYDSLDGSRLPYALPRIHTISQEDSILVTTEQRLPGTPMFDLLPTLAPQQLEQMMQQYLAAVLALSEVTIPAPVERLKLFDRTGISRGGDWHRFLSRYLAEKLGQVEPYLVRDVLDFGVKVRRLQAILARPYSGRYGLIHGDFFPGNLLVDGEAGGRISGLLDFGFMTMFGDPLFDVATSWVFFDMYDQLKANLRERYLRVILKRLGDEVRGKLYRYVLVYSILSANSYSSRCSDGHYQWCAANLNHQAYWQDIE